MGNKISRKGEAARKGNFHFHLYFHLYFHFQSSAWGKCETDLNAFLSVFPASAVNICLTDCTEESPGHFCELSPCCSSDCFLWLLSLAFVVAVSFLQVSVFGVSVSVSVSVFCLLSAAFALCNCHVFIKPFIDCTANGVQYGIQEYKICGHR